MDFAELLEEVCAIEGERRLFHERFTPDVNPFDVLAPNEMGLSKALAWLLNPEQAHGQRGRFLRSFLVKLVKGDHTEVWPLEACDRAKVRLEVPTETGRVDIHIEVAEAHIVVENKPSAVDGPRQLERYFSTLGRRTLNHHCLIYLTPGGSPPSAASLGPAEMKARTEAGQLYLWAYRKDILDWLADCRNGCRADRVNAFINDFSRYIRRRFNGVQDMSTQDPLVKLATATPEAVSSAMQIINVADELRETLLTKLNNQLTTLIEEQSPKRFILNWNMSYVQRPDENWDGLSLVPSCSHDFSLEFEGSGLYFGLSRRTAGSSDPIVRKAISSLLGDGEENNWWLWRRLAQENDEYLPIEPNWEKSTKPWVMIADGTMAEIIFKAANRLLEAMEQCDRRANPAMSR